MYREWGTPTDNDTAFPIVSAYVGSAENVERGGQLLFEEGINVTLQGYPLVPRDKGVLRATPAHHRRGPRPPDTDGAVTAQ